MTLHGQKNGKSQMRVLVSAYACEPGKGSEPGIGWNWVRQVSRFHQTWVITRANNREPIEAALAQEPLRNVHFVYFDLPRWVRVWKKGARGVRLYYYLWQIGAYLVCRKLHRRVDFDLVHHVTLGTYWTACFTVLLPVPLVWGPVGGGESAPAGFWSSFGPRGKTYEVARDLARFVGELDPFVRLTARRAAVAIATSEETKRKLFRLGSRNIAVLPQVGLSEDEILGLNKISLRRGDPFRLVSIGRLLHWKGFELGLKAFAEFHRTEPASEYWIIGDGPERRRLQQVAKRLNISEKVTFLGALPRAETLSRIADCDVLVHPSLHDSGGWVCLEAMATGRPVVCLDLGGPALQVSEETGVKVPAISPRQVVADLATVFGRLARDPELRIRLGQAGRRRVTEHFSWQRKGDELTHTYNKGISIEEEHVALS